MAVSREVRQLRRDVQRAFRSRGHRIGLRRAWTVFDHDAGLVDRCPTCYNSAYSEATDPKCPTCYGTGFDEGYRDPEITWGLVEFTGDEDIKYDRDGVLLETSATLKTGFPPMINDGDLVVEVTAFDIDRKISSVGLAWSIDGGVSRQEVLGRVSNNRVGRIRPDEIIASQSASVKPMLPDDQRSLLDFWRGETSFVVGEE